MKRPSKIVITGEGGQGVQAIAKILAQAAFNSGKEATYLPNFGVEQRGGVSIAYVQICGCGEEGTVCDCHIGFPKFDKTDILVNLRDRAVERTKKYVTADTLYIYDNGLVKAESVKNIRCEKIAIPAENYAMHKLDQRVFNIIVLGTIIEVTKIVEKKAVLAVMDELFKEKYKKRPELRHLNNKAFEVGVEMITKVKGRALT